MKRSSAGASKVQPTGQTKSPKMYFLYKLEIATFPIFLLVSPFIQHYGGVGWGARHHPKKHSEAVIERMACLPQSVDPRATRGAGKSSLNILKSNCGNRETETESDYRRAATDRSETGRVEQRIGRDAHGVCGFSRPTDY